VILLARTAPLAYIGRMLIIETPIFTRRIQHLLSDEQYRAVQEQVVARPDAGDVIPGSGGLRKLRWAMAGHGKRGGLRIIYYWARAADQILMLFVYPKPEREDLTPAQLRQLKRIVDEEYR
jgi:hypothetical protein